MASLRHSRDGANRQGRHDPRTQTRGFGKCIGSRRFVGGRIGFVFSLVIICGGKYGQPEREVGKNAGGTSTRERLSNDRRGGRAGGTDVESAGSADPWHGKRRLHFVG